MNSIEDLMKWVKKEIATYEATEGCVSVGSFGHTEAATAVRVLRQVEDGIRRIVTWPRVLRLYRVYGVNNEYDLIEAIIARPDMVPSAGELAVAV